MKTWLEIIGGLLVRPRRGVRRVILQKPAALAVLVFLLASLSVLTGLSLEGTVGMAGGAPVFAARTAAVLAAGLAVAFALTALLHLSCDLLRGAGSGTALYLSLLLASLPWIFLAGAGLIISVAALPPAAHVAVKGAFGAWSALIALKAVQEIYRFGMFRAVLALVLPLVALAAGTAGILFLMVA